MTSSRVALCGAGMISHVHVLAARSLGMELVAIASRSEERRSRRARELGVGAISFDELPAGADIVIVATPPSAHFAHVLHSLERGAAVVVEKPLVTTLDQADRLVEIASLHDHRLLYAENLAYAPAFRAWVTQIAEMSTLGHLSARMEQSPPTWGDFLRPDWGGGVLFDLGVHPIALIVLTARAAGAGEVVSVVAQMEGDSTDEIADITLTFASGLTARIVTSWRGGDPPHWSLQAASDSAAVTLELMPDIALERNGDPISLAPPRTEPATIEQLGYVDQLRAFRSDLDSGSVPWMNAEFGRWILEIVCACSVSARRGGEPVPVPSGCDRTRTPWELWRS